MASPDGETLFIANEADGLTVLEVGTGRTTWVPLTGGGFGMAASPGWDRLFITVPAQGLVEVVEVSSLTVVSTITIGGAPRRIAFDSFGTVAVVANEAGRVDFIR